eukprot:4720596-Prymnesium_polylepis.1
MALHVSRALLQRIFEISCDCCERMLRQNSILTSSTSVSSPLECRNNRLGSNVSAEMVGPVDRSAITAAATFHPPTTTPRATWGV